MFSTLTNLCRMIIVAAFFLNIAHPGPVFGPAKSLDRGVSDDMANENKQSL